MSASERDATIPDAEWRKCEHLPQFLVHSCGAICDSQAVEAHLRWHDGLTTAIQALTNASLDTVSPIMLSLYGPAFGIEVL
jgi:hypothetical protein